MTVNVETVKYGHYEKLMTMKSTMMIKTTKMMTEKSRWVKMGDDGVGYQDLISCLHSQTHTDTQEQQQQTSAAAAAEATVIIHHQLGVMGCIELFFFSSFPLGDWKNGEVFSGLLSVLSFDRTCLLFAS